MNTEYKVDYPVSAGGVVYRLLGSQVEITLCGRDTPQGWLWALPKGTPQDKETIEETALREVREETGLDVAIDRPIDSINYWFVRPSDGVNCHKTVHFFLMVPTGGDVAKHDAEFDKVEWHTADDALKLLTHQNEVAILQTAMNLTPGKPVE